MGAVTDPRPQHLVQFAQMGSIYIEQALGVARPKVGLLSNGEEPSKGNQLVQETFPLLAGAPGIDFHGNVEGNDITRGVVDVVVTDGFTGNVALKTAEGAAALINATVRDRLTASPIRKALAALAAAGVPRSAQGARLRRAGRGATAGHRRRGDHLPRPLE